MAATSTYTDVLLRFSNQKIMASGSTGGGASGGVPSGFAVAEAEEGEGAGRLAMESRKSEEEVNTEKGRQETIDNNLAASMCVWVCPASCRTCVSSGRKIRQDSMI